MITMEQIVSILDILNTLLATLDTANATQAVSASPMLTLGKTKVKKLPLYNSQSDKLSNQLFLIYKYLIIIGIMNSNMKEKFLLLLLKGKALTWWGVYSQTTANNLTILQWEDVGSKLQYKFQEIDHE